MPATAQTLKNDETAATASVEQETFLSLIDEHQRMLMKVCWAYTYKSHDRDDLFQEIVSRLWQSFANYDRDRPFPTWMYRVALNVAIDFRRRHQRRTTESLNHDAALDPPSPHDEPKQKQLEQLRELLEQQTEADRAILLLTLEGNSYREIAEIIGISESNVGTRLSRLKKSLRDAVHSSD
jgi:RNA polymerase sigma-70 factor (ECF subfamily)